MATTVLDMARTGSGQMGAMPTCSPPSVASYLISQDQTITRPTSEVVMVPRCEVSVEFCNTGIRVYCVCEDDISTSNLIALTRMTAGGMCSICCMMNGMVLLQANFPLCNCSFEYIDHGVVFVLLAIDSAVMALLQGQLDCMNRLMQAGCMCCICISGVPICVGTGGTSLRHKENQPVVELPTFSSKVSLESNIGPAKIIASPDRQHEKKAQVRKLTKLVGSIANEINETVEAADQLIAYLKSRESH